MIKKIYCLFKSKYFRTKKISLIQEQLSISLLLILISKIIPTSFIYIFQAICRSKKVVDNLIIDFIINSQNLFSSELKMSYVKIESPSNGFFNEKKYFKIKINLKSQTNQINNTVSYE